MRYRRIFSLIAILVFTFEYINAQCIARSSGSDNQTVCVNTAIGSISYTVITGVTGIDASGFPAGVSGSLVGTTYTITGIPTASGPFTYVLRTLGSCEGVISGTINVDPNATISLSSNPPSINQTVCQNTSINNITYLITGTTSATFSGLPAGVTGSYSSGTVTISGTPGVSGNYNYTVATVGPCVQTSASGTINVTPNAGISLTSAIGTNAQSICIGSSITNISYTITGGGTGASVTGLPSGVTGSFSSGIYTISGTPTAPGAYNYTVTTSGSCSQTSASGSITVNPNTTIALTSGAGTNVQSVCQNHAMNSITYQITNGTGAGVTGLPAGVTGSYNTGVFTISGTPTAAGIFNYTVTTTGLCGQSTASGTITVNLNAVITLSSAAGTNNQSVCINSAITNISYQTTGATGVNATGLPAGVTGLYSSGIYTIRGTPTQTGIFNYTLTTTGTCIPASASGTITVTALPVATATNNGPICAGRPLILTGGPAGMTSYLWSGPNGFSSTLQSPTVSLIATAGMAGVYTLTVTNSNGCVDTETTTVVINPIPAGTAINSGPVCIGSPLSLTGGPAGMTTYSWTGPNSFASAEQSPVISTNATLLMNGRYLLTITNANGCQDTISTRARIYEIPVSNAGTGGTECDLDFILNAVPSTGIGLWTMVTGPDAATATFLPGPNSATATVTVSAYGTYTFRWTETNGPCTSSSVITVNFYQRPVANAGTAGNECDLSHVMNAVPSVGTGTWTMTSGTGTATFTPNANTATAQVTVSTYGTKTFTWTEVNGICSASATVNVNFYQQPVANPGTGGNNCGIEFNFKATPSVGTGTWTKVSGPGNVTFSPNANSATAKATVSAYGAYVFSWTEVNGSCSNSANISVTFIQQPSANAGNGGDECDKNFTFNAIKGTGTGVWSKVTGPGTATFSNASLPNSTVTVSQFGSYDFAWTETNSLCTSSDIVRVTFHDLPSVNAGPDLAVCKGSNIRLSAAGTGSFLWSPANLLNSATVSNPLATPIETTTFTVTLTDQYGCKNSDQVNVEVRNQPVADAGPDQALKYVFEASLAAVPPAAGQTGKWSLLEGTGEFSDDSNYASEVTGLELGVNSFIWTLSNGVCPLSKDTVNIEIQNLIIPTLITPNLDGRNDFFVINGISTFGKTSLTVFNRWGARVFENKNYDNKWNGVDENGDPLQDDTYFYILKPEKINAIKGYIVIRR